MHDVTSSVDFCEANWVSSNFLAEIHNSISSLIYCILGIHGLYNLSSQHLPTDKFFKLSLQPLFASLITIGIGSFFLHACLCWLGQALDEIPMLLFNLLVIYIMAINPKASSLDTALYTREFSVAAIAIVFAYFAFQRFYIIFILMYGFLAISGLATIARRSYKASPLAYGLFLVLLVTFGFIGFTSWVYELAMCGTLIYANININFHVIWHTFSAIGAYAGILACVAIRYPQAARLKLFPIPLVVADDTETEALESLID